jgi:uncharacterized membrane protein (UPF0182 family)
MWLVRVIFGILLFLVIAGSVAFNILGDFWWFQSVGYQSVFLKVLLTSLAIGSISFAVFFAISIVNILMARRAALGKKNRGKGVKDRLGTRAIIILAAVIGLIVALSMGNSWETVLKYTKGTSFGVPDPVFGMDISFFVFTLPFYSFVLNFLLAVLITSAFLSLVTYILYSKGFSIQVQQEESDDTVSSVFMSQPARHMSVNWSGSWRKFMPQLSILIFLIFMVIATKIWLARYDLLYSSGGAVFGAGYTAINVSLPMLMLLSGVTFLIGIAFLANIKMRRPRFIAYGIGALVIISVIGSIVGGVVQALVVMPDEFNLERPYLERNIQGTLAAYGLGSAEEKTFPVNFTLTADDIQANAATVSNIRLWDWRPLKQTYEQLQLFRTYYEFNDVDVDRYRKTGPDMGQQAPGLYPRIWSCDEPRGPGLARRPSTLLPAGHPHDLPVHHPGRAAHILRREGR